MRFVGNGLREQGLSTSGRAPKKHANGLVETNRRKHGRILDRKHNRHLKLLTDGLQSTDGVPSDVGHCGETFTLARGLDLRDGDKEVGVGDGERGKLFGGELGGVGGEEVLNQTGRTVDL